MKDKSQFIGFLLIAVALLLMFRLDKHRASDEQKALPLVSEITEQIRDEPNEQQLFPVTAIVDNIGEQLFTLENDVLKVVFSNVGGAIKSVELKKYQAVQGEREFVSFNEKSKINALAIYPRDSKLRLQKPAEIFEVEAISRNKIQFRRVSNDGCIVMRTYVIQEKDGKKFDGHVIKHETAFKNATANALDIGNICLFLGTMPATASDSLGDYLNFGSFNGKKDNFIKLRDFKASNGFFGLGKRYERKIISSEEKVLWGSVKNQFFAAVLTPGSEADGYVVTPMAVAENSGQKEDLIAGALTFDIGTLRPSAEKTLTANFYVGPKDFSRLCALGNEQDRVMQFGFFGSISELLLRMMIKIHSLVPNWGWTIIILTAIVKLLLWPLTTAQVRSSKKMSAIQEPLKLIKEKFKNNPQKLQAETLKLFRDNRINPAAGCLPIFIQIPIFFGLYYMLRTASDLRFAHFLWISDLSLPDTIARIGRFPINVLPIVMGATMFWQMHMTPMPTSDNSQKLMFKLMPLIFFMCCYNFPSGLVLYWTVQNLLTIIQQQVVSKTVTAKTKIDGLAVGPNTKKSIRNRPPRRTKGRNNNVRS